MTIWSAPARDPDRSGRANCRADAPDAMALEEFFDLCLA
jgi:hypothetical protein